MDEIQTFLFDCDGVLWHGDETIEGAKEALQALSEKGKDIILVTNNSTSSRQAYLAKVERLFGPGHNLNLTKDNIFGSAYSAAYYLDSIARVPKDKAIYVIGQSGIVDEIQDMGYRVISSESSGDTDSMHSIHEQWLQLATLQIAAVVIGFDLFFNYRKLTQAFRLLHGKTDAEILFIATNTDSSYPSSLGVFPGTGSFVSSLSACCERTPIVTGKPSATLFQCIQDKMRLDPRTTCMIGDRLDTDIAFGRDHGCRTVLVLTGISKQSEICDSLRPDHVIPSIKDLPSLFLLKD